MVDTTTQDSEFARPPSNWFKFGKIEDTIKGKLVSRFQKEDKFHPGEQMWVYEVEVESGHFHNIIEKVVSDIDTQLTAGETYSISGKTIIDNVMKKCAIGQRCKMTYTADYTKNGTTSKTVNVLLDTTFVPPTETAPF